MPTSAALYLVLSNNHLLTKLVATKTWVECPFWVLILHTFARHHMTQITHHKSKSDADSSYACKNTLCTQFLFPPSIHTYPKSMRSFFVVPAGPLLAVKLLILLRLNCEYYSSTLWLTLKIVFRVGINNKNVTVLQKTAPHRMKTCRDWEAAAGQETEVLGVGSTGVWEANVQADKRGRRQTRMLLLPASGGHHRPRCIYYCNFDRRFHCYCCSFLVDCCLSAASVSAAVPANFSTATTTASAFISTGPLPLSPPLMLPPLQQRMVAVDAMIKSLVGEQEEVDLPPPTLKFNHKWCLCCPQNWFWDRKSVHHKQKTHIMCLWRTNTKLNFRNAPIIQQQISKGEAPHRIN